MWIDEYIKNDQNVEKEELMLPKSVQYWKNMLFEKCVRIFEWQGLDFPQQEIETRLLYNGFCGFVNDAKMGLMVANGSMSGVTQYYDIFTHFTYASPTATGGTLKIGKKAIIINNTALRNSLYPLIYRYACLLAHCDVSLKMALVNLRMKNIVVSDDGNTAETFRQMYKKFYNGDVDAIIDDGFTDAKNIAPTMSGSLGVMDCIDARNELLRMFYNEIGIKYARDKKERMITSEVESDRQMLLFNINDMLKQREKACAEINRLFNTNITVKLSDEFTIGAEEEGENENNIK